MARRLIAGENLGAAETSRLHEQNREHGQDEAEHGCRDEQDAELAVVGRNLDRASRTSHFTCDDEELIQVFRRELRGRQREVLERSQHGEESSLRPSGAAAAFESQLILVLNSSKTSSADIALVENQPYLTPVAWKSDPHQSRGFDCEALDIVVPPKRLYHPYRWYLDGVWMLYERA
jgi:hypothetical protein